MLHLAQRLHGGHGLRPAAASMVDVDFTTTSVVDMQILQLIGHGPASLACALCSAVTGESIQQLGVTCMSGLRINQGDLLRVLVSNHMRATCTCIFTAERIRHRRNVRWEPGPTCMTPASEAEHDQALSAITPAATLKTTNLRRRAVYGVVVCHYACRCQERTEAPHLHELFSPKTKNSKSRFSTFTPNKVLYVPTLTE